MARALIFPVRPRLVGSLALTVATCVAATACTDRTAPKSTTALASASAMASDPSSGPLPPRPAAVAIADRLALAGSRRNGAEGESLLFQAARLRERLFRVEGREVDALEARELFRAVEDRGGAMRCEAGLRRALLAGESGEGPSAVRRRLDEVFVGGSRECEGRVARAKALLAAYRQLPELAAVAPQPPATSSQPVPSASAAEKPPPEPGPGVLERVEPFGAEDVSRVVLYLTAPVRYEVGTVVASGGRGPRVYLDLKQVRYRGPLEVPSEGLLERVRLGKRRDGTRVVLDLAAQSRHRVFPIPEPYRLVIDVVRGTRVSRSPGKDGKRRVDRVVLDPGHGGHDPGAVGPSGLREKDVTLDVAHRAAPLIARELGISTLLTRDTDVFVSLPERTARANAFNADLFVSIHCNASPDGEGNGVMTFVLDRSRDEASRTVAARENAASAQAAEELASTLERMIGKEDVAQSLRFAELLQRSAMSSLSSSYGGVEDRGVKRAGFYVLAGAHMPAVLFETSFISEEREERRLSSAAYRQKLADSIVNAIRAYREGR